MTNHAIQKPIALAKAECTLSDSSLTKSVALIHKFTQLYYSKNILKHPLKQDISASISLTLVV